MAPITTASNEETHAALLDALDMTKVRKPFRNPDYKPATRRNKNLKQILAEAQRAQQSLINTQQNSGASTPVPAADGTATPSLDQDPAQGSHDLGRLVLDKNAKQANGLGASLNVPTVAREPSVTYTSIAAPPSTKPKKKYCDITGLPAKYTDPKTGLFYFNAEVYQVVKSLNTTQVQEYLAARGANTMPVVDRDVSWKRRLPVKEATPCRDKTPIKTKTLLKDQTPVKEDSPVQEAAPLIAETSLAEQTPAPEEAAPLTEKSTPSPEEAAPLSEETAPLTTRQHVQDESPRKKNRMMMELEAVAQYQTMFATELRSGRTRRETELHQQGS